MVLELVLSGFISAAAGHFGKRIAAVLDERVGRAVAGGSSEDRSEAFAPLLERSSSGDTAAIVEVESRVSAFLRAHPDDGAALVAEVLEATGSSAANAPTPTLAGYQNFLDNTIDMVRRMPPPVVALPGWFHTTDCVTIIDARRGDQVGFQTAVATPRTWADASGLREAEPGDNYFYLPSFNDSVDGGYPRMWVIDCDGPDDRDGVLVLLNRRFTVIDAPSPRVLEMELPGVAEVEPDRIRMVHRLFERKVVLRPLGWRFKEAPDVRDIEAYIAYMNRPRPETELPISDLGGVKLARRALAQKVAAHDQFVAEASGL
jgi:hypothetical protein